MASSRKEEEHDYRPINNEASQSGEERSNSLERASAKLENKLSCKCFWGSLGLIVFMLLVLLLIGMTTAALVVIPISRAFSDAPNRLLGFYETVVVVAGAYLVYKGIFDKKPTLESAIKKRNANGDTNGSNQQYASDSEDKRLAAFYDHVVNIVLNYKVDSTEESEN